MTRHKLTNACDISPKVRRIVEERDDGICINCHMARGIPNAHYIPRGQQGLGIPENIVSLCAECHTAYDQGGKRELIGKRIREYLDKLYPGFPDSERIYKK